MLQTGSEREPSRPSGRHTAHQRILRAPQAHRRFALDRVSKKRKQVEQDFLVTEEVAALTRLRRNYLERLRCSGGGPPYLKISARRVIYRREDVFAWLNARRHLNTATAAPLPHD